MHVLIRTGDTTAPQFGCPAASEVAECERPELPRGSLDPRVMPALIDALLLENVIVVDEALTSGVGLTEMASAGARHDMLSLAGGATGDRLSKALGAGSPAQIARSSASRPTGAR